MALKLKGQYKRDTGTSRALNKVQNMIAETQNTRAT